MLTKKQWWLAVLFGVLILLNTANLRKNFPEEMAAYYHCLGAATSGLLIGAFSIYLGKKVG